MELSSIFNAQTMFNAAIDVALFAWMHFTVSGMAFGAGVAETFGMIQPLADSGLVEVVASTGEAAYAL